MKSILLSLTARVEVRGCGHTHKRCHDGVVREFDRSEKSQA